MYLLLIAGSDAIVESIVSEHPPAIDPGLTFRLPVSTYSLRAWVTAHDRVEQVALDTKVRKKLITLYRKKLREAEIMTVRFS